MEEPRKIQFDLKDYKNGKLLVQQVGQSFVLVKPQWDKDSGASIDPIIIPLNKKNIESSIENNLKTIDSIKESNEILKEILTKISEG